MVFGYARVSTSSQNLDMQLDSFETFSIESKNIFTDKASGAKEERKGLNSMLMRLREGDTVIVWKMCRIARNTKHMLSMMEFFETNKINFKSIQEPFLDTSSPYGRFIFTIFASLYQMEREINSERVVEGQKSAIARGVLIGRPKGLSIRLQRLAPAAVAMHKNEKLSIKKICKALEVAQGSLYNMFDYEKYNFRKTHKNKGNKNAAYKVKVKKAA